MNKAIIFMVGILLGILLGEHKTCVEMGGNYKMDYGKCEVSK